MTSWEFDRSPTPEPQPEIQPVQSAPLLVGSNSHLISRGLPLSRLVDEPVSLEAVDDFLNGDANGVDYPDLNFRASFEGFDDCPLVPGQGGPGEQSFKISLTNMLPYLLKIPNDNIQDQTVKTLTLLCEPLGEIREYFSMTMVDTIIPEICTNYNPSDQQLTPMRKFFWHAAARQPSEALGANYYIKVFEL